MSTPELKTTMFQPEGWQSDGYLADTALMDFITCPWLYFRRHHLDDHQQADAIDHAAHLRVLQGRDVYERDAAHHLNAEQQNLLEFMAVGVGMNDEAVNRILLGWAAQTATACVEGQSIAATMDWVHPHGGIVEFVVVDRLPWFESCVRHHRIVEKLVLQRMVLRTKLDDDKATIRLHCVVVEQQDPQRCGVWEISDATAGIAEIEVKAAIRQFRECTASGYWPTHYENVMAL